MAVTILDGSTFCISDDEGNIAGSTSGFFASDTRFHVTSLPGNYGEVEPALRRGAADVVVVVPRGVEDEVLRLAGENDKVGFPRCNNLFSLFRTVDPADHGDL